MLNHDKKDFCKVCLLAIGTKATLDGLKMDVDMLVRKVNEIDQSINIKNFERKSQVME